MPGVKMVEALAQCGAVAVLSQPENRGKLALFAGIDDVRFKRVVRPGDVLTLECQVETVRGPIGRGKVKATVDGQLAVRGTLTFAVGDEQMIARTNGNPISITGLGCHVPERVLDNDELSTIVDTNDEWIVERTGIRERRIAADDEALTDICLPAARRALEMAGRRPGVDRSADRRDRHARHGVPVVERVDGRHARHAAGRGVRPLGRVHRLRLRDRPGARHALVRPCEAGARRRRRRSLDASSTGPTARRSCSSATAPARS